MKPTQKQIDAFFQGMEFAARHVSGLQEHEAALEIRRMSDQLKPKKENTNVTAFRHRG